METFLNTCMMRKLTTLVLSAALLIAASGCTPGNIVAQNGAGVAGAYETSGLIPMAPYTRTIFSQNNF